MAAAIYPDTSSTNSTQEKEDTGKNLTAYKKPSTWAKPEENHNKKIQQAQNLTNTTAVYVAPMREKTTKKDV